MKRKGQALYEYAIALGLLAIVSIGALQLLGWNVNNLFGQATSARTVSQTDQLFSLIGASSQGSGQPAQLKAANIPQNVLLKIDPDTGKVLISDQSGGEKNSTSVDGAAFITGASQALADLSKTTLANGEPLPDDIQALLKKLSASGSQLGQYYSAFEANQDAIAQLSQAMTQQQQAGQFSGPPYYPAELVTQTIGYTEQYIQLSQTYHQLEAKLGTLAQNDPAVAELKQKISSYAGAISTTAHENVGQPFFSDMHIEHVQSADLMAALRDNPTAAQYFQQVNSQTAHMPPAEREAYFQQSILTIGEQMKVGAPIDGQGMSIALAPPQSASN